MIKKIFTLLLLFTFTFALGSFESNAAELNPFNPNFLKTPVIFGMDLNEETNQQLNLYPNAKLNTMSFFPQLFASEGFDTTSLTKVYETAAYGGTIRAIHVTDTHVWYAGATTQTVKGWNIATQTVEYETPDYGGTIRAIHVTDTHVWYGGSTTQTVKGWNIATETVEYETPNYNGSIESIFVTSDYVWYAGSQETVVGQPFSTTVSRLLSIVPIFVILMIIISLTLLVTVSNASSTEKFVTGVLIVVIGLTLLVVINGFIFIR